MQTSDEALKFLRDVLLRMTVNCVDPDAETRCRYVKEILQAVDATIGERSLKKSIGAGLEAFTVQGGFKKPSEVYNPHPTQLLGQKQVVT